MIIYMRLIYIIISHSACDCFVPNNGLCAMISWYFTLVGDCQTVLYICEPSLLGFRVFPQVLVLMKNK